MKEKYAATIIGIIISIPGILMLMDSGVAFFISIPIFSMLPLGLPLEILGQKIFEDYRYTAILEILLLAIVFLFSSYLFLKALIRHRARHHRLNKGLLLGYFCLQLLVVHPLAFYIWAYGNAENAGDGQFIFGLFGTFPISSIAFIPLGIFIDILKNKSLKADARNL
jgi:hypothetical protein